MCVLDTNEQCPKSQKVALSSLKEICSFVLKRHKIKPKHAHGDYFNLLDASDIYYLEIATTICLTGNANHL